MVSIANRVQLTAVSINCSGKEDSLQNFQAEAHSNSMICFVGRLLYL